MKTLVIAALIIGGVVAVSYHYAPKETSKVGEALKQNGKRLGEKLADKGKRAGKEFVN